MSDNRVERLSGPHAALFALGCAQRLLPLYQLFQQEQRFDLDSVLPALLARLWTELEQHSGTRPLSGLAAVASRFIPHADDFGGCLITAAQNFGVCIDVALEFGGEPHDPQVTVVCVPDLVEEALVSVELCRTTGYLNAGDDEALSNIEKRILDGDVLRAERARQSRCLKAIIASALLTPDLVRGVREQSLR